MKKTAIRTNKVGRLGLKIQIFAASISFQAESDSKLSFQKRSGIFEQREILFFNKDP